MIHLVTGTSSFDHYLLNHDQTFLFQCNCTSKEFSHISNKFIKQVCMFWFETVLSEPKDGFGNQILWNIEYININNKCIFDKFLFEKDIVYVKDLFDASGKVLLFNQFKEKLALESSPFTTFLELIDPFPCKVKQSLRQQHPYQGTGSQLKDSNLHTTSISHKVYNVLLAKVTVVTSAISKWNLSCNIPTDSWERILSYLIILFLIQRFFIFSFVSFIEF